MNINEEGKYYASTHEYGLVILPMTVVKRFHDCLLPTHKAVFFWSAIAGL